LTITQKTGRIFKENFSTDPIIVRAPGRINIIGEHTDYNLGFVLPAAIDRFVYAAVALSGSEQCHLMALDLGKTHSFHIHKAERTGTWADYIIGVFRELKDKYQIDGGFNMVITGDIPAGAGLSSSAALECSAGLALQQVYGLNLEKIDLVRTGLRAEINFVGLACGIMDQYASVFGEQDKVLLIDCMNETHRYVDLNLGDYQLLLVNSLVTHDLADSAYNERRKECERGVEAVRREFPHVTSLREVSMDMLNRVKREMEEVIYRRAGYVIRENERVLETTDLLENNSIEEVGRILFEAHDDMRVNYEITCAETDFLVTLARESGLISGARQMGGGFGGCTLNLLHGKDVAAFKDYTSSRYMNKFGHEPMFIEVSTASGASVIK